MTDVLAQSSAVLAPIALEELNASAELLARIDRKYVIDASVVRALLDEHRDHLAVLDIDGTRAFTYESVYFDTEHHDLYRAAAMHRRNRFKVRTRLYEDAGVVMLEVKTKDGRGRTLKHRMERAACDRDRLTQEDRCFIDEVAPTALASGLEPTLTTRYLRTTLVDLDDGSRATVDQHLVCSEPDGTSVSVDHVIVETKSDGSASPLDRWLWRSGIRPVRISKYCTALAVLHPELPTNKWHRTIVRHFSC